MKANDFDIIFQKTFQELTEADKLEMQEMFTTEDEFLQLKYVLSSINSTVLEQEKAIEPSPRIKENLDHLFNQTYQNKGILWYNAVGTFFISKEKKLYQQNLVRIAAVLLVMLLVVPLWNNDLKQEKPMLSQLDKTPEEKADDTKTETSVSPTENKSDSFQSTVVKDTQGKDVTVAFDKSAGDSFEKLAEASRDEEALEDLSQDAKVSPQPEMTFAGTAVSKHPDGIFIGATDDAIRPSNFALKDHLDVLDILTATY